MSRNNDNSFWGWVLVGVVAVIVYTIWQFSTYFGLDMHTGFTVFGSMAVIGVLVFLSLYCDYDILRLGNTWPLLLAALFMSWWPALDFWASKDIPSFLDPESVSIWWDTWYFKWGTLVSIAGAGYFLKKLYADYVNG